MKIHTLKFVNTVSKVESEIYPNNNKKCES